MWELFNFSMSSYFIILVFITLKLTNNNTFIQSSTMIFHIIHSQYTDYVTQRQNDCLTVKHWVSTLNKLEGKEEE